MSPGRRVSYQHRGEGDDGKRGEGGKGAVGTTEKGRGGKGRAGLEKGEDEVVVEGRGRELGINGEDGVVRGRGDPSGEGSEKEGIMEKLERR